MVRRRRGPRALRSGGVGVRRPFPPLLFGQDGSLARGPVLHWGAPGRLPVAAVVPVLLPRLVAAVVGAVPSEHPVYIFWDHSWTGFNAHMLNEEQ